MMYQERYIDLNGSSVRVVGLTKKNKFMELRKRLIELTKENESTVFIQYLLDPSLEKEMIDYLLEDRRLNKLLLFDKEFGINKLSEEQFIMIEFQGSEFVDNGQFLKDRVHKQILFEYYLSKFSQEVELENFIKSIKEINAYARWLEYDCISNEKYLDIFIIVESLNIEGKLKLLEIVNLIPEKIIKEMNDSYEKTLIDNWDTLDTPLMISLIDQTNSEKRFQDMLDARFKEQEDNWAIKLSVSDDLVELMKSKYWKTLGTKTVLKCFNGDAFTSRPGFNELVTFIEEFKLLRKSSSALAKKVKDNIIEMLKEDLEDKNIKEEISAIKLLKEHNYVLPKDIRDILEYFPVKGLRQYKNNILELSINNKQFERIINNARERDLSEVMVYIDGPNVARFGEEKNEDGKIGGKVENIVKMIKFLNKKGIKNVKVVISSAMEYWIDNKKKLKKLKPIIAAGGESDDRTLIILAERDAALIITNDQFRDWKNKETNLKAYLDESRVSFSIDLENYNFTFGEKLQKLIGDVEI